MASITNTEAAPNTYLNFYKRYVHIIHFLIIIVIGIIIWFFNKEFYNIKIQQLADNTKFTQNINKLLSNINLTNAAVNQLGTRIATLDKQSYNSLIPISLSSLETFRGKDHLVSGGYLNELELFKSLSPMDQHNYINMSREQKQSKYGNKLNLK